MKWYCVFINVDTLPIDWDKLAAADVIYTFIGALRHLPPHRLRNKVLVVFVDKLFLGRSFLPAIGRLNEYPADIYLDLPPSKFYDEEIKHTRRLSGVIERGTAMPWAQNPPLCTQPERRFLHFARSDPRFEGYVKGTDYLLELLDEFPHDVIGNVPVGNFLGWVSLSEQLALQRKCRLLLHPSRLDSIPRMLAAALCLEQVSVLAFREAEYTWSLGFGQPPDQYLPQYFPIARGKEEFQNIARHLMMDDDAHQEALNKLQAYKTRHPIIWDTYAMYQAFAEKGLLLPRDLTPLHFMPNRELFDSLPAGPWSGNPLSLNFV